METTQINQIYDDSSEREDGLDSGEIRSGKTN